MWAGDGGGRVGGGVRGGRVGVVADGLFAAGRSAGALVDEDARTEELLLRRSVRGLPSFAKVAFEGTAPVGIMIALASTGAPRVGRVRVGG